MHFSAWTSNYVKGPWISEEQFFNLGSLYDILLYGFCILFADNYINVGTAFAYGQTSSGKTFTMNGSESDPGIIHQAVNDVFRNIQMVW